MADACRASGGSIQTGPFGSQLHAEDYVIEGVPSIMPVNIGDNRIIEDGIARISEEDAIRLSRYLVKEGDIIYSRRGDVRRRALIREHETGWLCGTGCLRIRFGDGSIDSRYVSYYLGHPDIQEWIARHAHGATMPNLNTSILSEVPFLLPPLPQQVAIAQILGVLDDKIELNRRMSQTLEEIARTLFKSWFVDFDPVHAKAAGRQPVGMDAETAALFPSEFEESELGLVPKGWRVSSLDKVATFLNGLALQKFPAVGGESLPAIKIAQLKRGSTEGADRVGTTVPEAYVVRDDDMLFSWSGSLELVIWHGGVGALNQHLFKVTPNSVPDWFVYFWIDRHLPEFREIAADKATTMGHIQRGHLAEALISLPPWAVLERAGQLLGSLLKRANQAAAETKTLAATRDLLLPELISGKLPVPLAMESMRA